MELSDTDREKLKKRPIVIDAPRPMACALQKVLSACLGIGKEQFNLVYDDPKAAGDTKRKELLDQLFRWADWQSGTREGRTQPMAVLPWLIIQYIDEASIKAAKTGFDAYSLMPGEEKAKWSDKRIKGGHPLTYRLSVNELSNRGVGAAMGPAFAGFSVPIVYVGLTRPPLSGEMLFLDSSIWHRYVCLPETLVRLLDVIQELWHYHRQGRYSLIVALEYLDYAIRCLREQRLVELQDKASHASSVSLLPFESESTAVESAAQLLAGKPVPRRTMLLVDDYAIEHLKPVIDGSGGSGITKKDVICEAITSPVELHDSSLIVVAKGTEVVPECVVSVQAAVTKMRDHEFDVIFLDYLLGGDKENRELGTELLEKIESGKVINGPVGPLGTYWVFPVSAFSGAFSAEMQSGRVQNIATKYLIGSGADPVCTPHLFRWKWLKFMEAQRSRCQEPLENVDWDFETPEMDPAKRTEKVRLAHSKLTQFQKQIAQLLDDACHGSLLASEILAKHRGTEESNKSPLVDGMPKWFFGRIMPYLESYLRRLAFGRHHGFESMLQDLEVMRLLALKAQAKEAQRKDREKAATTANDGLAGPVADHFIEWIVKQRKHRIGEHERAGR
ncbi:MAG: hypothetical protein WCN95_11330 [bacterium]